MSPRPRRAGGSRCCATSTPSVRTSRAPSARTRRASPTTSCRSSPRSPSGAGLRDYIRVEDLAAGHVAALNKLAGTDEPVSTWNLGTGTGTSVLEMLHAFERAVGRELPYEVVARRAGDIAVSYADPSRANAELGWRAERTIDDMCADTWRWQQQNPTGYPDA